MSRRILEATVELLGEVGYSELTVDAVAARATVGRPAIYRRFRGKSELCVAAIGSLLPPHIRFEQAKEMANALRRGDPGRGDVVRHSMRGKLAEFLTR